jgi:O-succinylbenzoic acid--CoA ligase
MGGAAPPKDLVDAARNRRLPLHLSYGLTEMASQVATTPPVDPADGPHWSSAGMVLPYRELKISRDGEILVRGKTLFEGYIEDDRLVRSLDSEGWFHTGDTGELTADGQLRVDGRRDEVFTSGGENISPAMIEDVLRTFEGIAEAVVVGVPDDEYGSRPFAFVALSDQDSRQIPRESRLIRDYLLLTRGGAPLPVQVREILKNRLPNFAIPLAIAPLPDLRDGRMKPDRKKLREIAEELRRVFPK